jgi:proteasome lid subunit RPN8/RPN11
MILTTAQLEQLVAQARADAPNETCGLVGGRDERALQIYPLKNVDENPRIRYLADPLELLHAIRDVEEAHDWQVLAIYHSHPASPAYPSATDVERAFYPDALYILISLMHPEMVDVRGYKIQEAKITEVTLDVEEEATNEQTRANPRRHQKTARRPPAHRAVAPLSKGRPKSRNTRTGRRRVSKKV